MKVLVATLSTLLHPLVASAADVSLLHPVFQNHVVLQRDAPIRLWGDAAPGARVTVQLETTQVQARADRQGHWETRLPAHTAGGPYQLKASTAKGVVQQIDDVLIGDVWLCSGQSNMELQVYRTLDSRSEIADADHPNIRMFNVPKQSSPTPQRSFGGTATWQRTTPETVKDFSATCYYFARELQKSVQVPMGLITASWGGSQLQAWISEKALRAVGEHGQTLDVLTRYAADPVAAAPRWAALWETWWHAHGEGEPWQPDAPGDWQNAPPALGAWDDWGVPQLVGFNGMVWYRTSIELTQAQAAQDATLLLGPVDEMDQTWVNGHGVGSGYGADQPRRYSLPRGRLHAGRNSIVLNVLNAYRRGGLLGDAQSRALQFADGSILALDAPWQYRIVPRSVGAPPRAPWSSAAGLTTLYNGMIAPLGHLSLRGVLWYQGESNVVDAAHYPALLSAWRHNWRQRFGATVPLLLVQLANYGTPPTQPTESGWAQVREAQRRLVADDAHAGLAVTIDIGERYDIHPANKQELGRRLSRAARHVVYGQAIPASGPVPRNARRENEGVRISFDDVDTALRSYGNDAPIGFEVCGDAIGSCRYTSATLSGREIRLRIPDGVQATRVRYCWADSPVCTLYDRSGLPAGPFELAITATPSP